MRRANCIVDYKRERERKKGGKLSIANSSNGANVAREIKNSSPFSVSFARTTRPPLVAPIDWPELDIRRRCLVSGGGGGSRNSICAQLAERRRDETGDDAPSELWHPLRRSCLCSNAYTLPRRPIHYPVARVPLSTRRRTSCGAHRSGRRQSVWRRREFFKNLQIQLAPQPAK